MIYIATYFPNIFKYFLGGQPIPDLWGQWVIFPKPILKIKIKIKNQKQKTDFRYLERWSYHG